MTKILYLAYILSISVLPNTFTGRTFRQFLQCALSRLPGFERFMRDFRCAPVRVRFDTCRHIAVATGLKSEGNRSHFEAFTVSIFDSNKVLQKDLVLMWGWD
jgi:hypothetical protein